MISETGSVRRFAGRAGRRLCHDGRMSGVESQRGTAEAGNQTRSGQTELLAPGDLVRHHLGDPDRRLNLSGGGYFWPAWAILGMGIALAFTAWGTFGKGDNVSQAKVEAEMRKMDGGTGT